MNIQSAQYDPLIPSDQYLRETSLYSVYEPLTGYFYDIYYWSGYIQPIHTIGSKLYEFQVISLQFIKFKINDVVILSNVPQGIYSNLTVEMIAGQSYKFDLYYMPLYQPPILSWRYDISSNFTEIPPEAYIHEINSNISLITNVIDLNTSVVLIDGNLSSNLLTLSNSTLIIKGDLTLTSDLVLDPEIPSSVSLSGCIFSNSSIKLKSIPLTSTKLTLLQFNCTSIPQIPVSFSDNYPCYSLAYEYTATALYVVVVSTNCGFDLTPVIIGATVSVIGLCIIIIVIYAIVRNSQYHTAKKKIGI